MSSETTGEICLFLHCSPHDQDSESSSFPTLEFQNFQDKYSNSKRADDAKPPARNADRHDPDAPPLHNLTEVVRMSRVAPQPSLQYLASILGISCELRKLCVSCRFEDEPEKPNAHADATKNIQGDSRRSINHQQWQRYQKQKRALKEIDL